VPRRTARSGTKRTVTKGKDVPFRETVAAVALLVTMVGPASANDARVLWAATRDAGGLEERAVDVAVDRTGIAVAAGLVAGGDGPSRFAVRALRVSTGALVWEDLPALGEASEAAGVAVGSGVAVVVGRRGAPEASDFVVRAYDLRSGALRWSELVDAGGLDLASHVATGAGLAVVTGLLDGVPLVRAYDVRTGAVRWEERGGGGGAVGIRGSVVLVGGGTTVRAYDLRSGRLRWSHVDAAEHVAAVALSPPYAVVAGLRRLGDDPEGPTDLLVRAHDLRTGRVVWTDAYDGGERDVANAVAVEGRVVVIAGSVRRHYDAPIVRAYDLVAGTILWTDLPSTADYDTRALDVAIHAGTAVVAGTLHSSHGVLAYGARRGTPLWRHDDTAISGWAWAGAG
jgi:outer membrane protein assembly factor BamB